MIDDCYALQADLAVRVLPASMPPDRTRSPPGSTARAAALAPAEAIAAELRAAAGPDLAMLVVAARQLRQALD